MARPSTSQFFNDVRNTVHQGDVHFEEYGEGFPAAPSSGRLLDIEAAEFALRHTAAACLGPDHSMYLHSFADGRRVGAQLRTIAAQCEAEMAGTPTESSLRVDVRGLFTTAFVYADSQRRLARILAQHPSPALAQNRAFAA